MHIQKFPHHSKLLGRIKKYKSEKPLLIEINNEYGKMIDNISNINVIDKKSIEELVSCVNNYLSFFSESRFDIIRKNSQSKIYPSILEEFMVYLFKDLIKPPLECGSGTVPIMCYFKNFSDVINSSSYEESITTEKTDADFLIGLPLKQMVRRKTIIYPLVIIENKRYADKTMRRIIENTAEKVKFFCQDCLYLLVVDLLRGFFAKNYSAKTSSIDQIYGLREGNSEGDERLRCDLVEKLFLDVKNHLDSLTNNLTLEDRYNRGYMMDR